MNIVLFEPEIPQNTGNIVRTCAATNSELHLIEPLGFEFSDKALRRAGLDYWKECDIKIYKNIVEFWEKNNGCEVFFASTKAAKRYDEVKYSENSFVFFGPESRGLPEDLLHDNYDKCVRIPMINDIRSLNLSNSVAIILYEALRQGEFAGFNTVGHLTKF
jgi:tRNA (cytidine/uridine-2'-O-)-methyltransferase